MGQGEPKPSPAKGGHLRGARHLFAVAIVGLALAYSVGIVVGWIPPGQRIDAVHLTILVIAAALVALLLKPEFFSRIKLFEFAGLKLEMQKFKEEQEDQQSRLELIDQILPILLPVAERKHLLNLAGDEAENYKGNQSLRNEIRRLRSIDLLKMKGNKHISEMRDGLVFDLGDFVQLTRSGRGWVDRIKGIEEFQDDQAK
jgi:hypothetical protein